MRKIAKDLLESDGYIADSADHPDLALKKLRENPPDLVLLDVRLPDRDGFQVLKEIKHDPKIRHLPVIMVSVKSEETDVVVGLELGADDYICKPFRKRELLARVKTTFRRRVEDPQPEKLEIGPITLDYASYTATLKKRPLPLTPKEFELLGYLIRQEGKVLTRPTLSEKVWGIEFTGSTRTIDVHVDQIRRKLGRYGSAIKSLKGIGYRFEWDRD